MRLTTRTNLAMRVLMYCAVNGTRIVRSAEIAENCNASANHLMQVVHLLHVNGFITAHRGRSGGLVLARPDTEISIGEVFRVFESGLPFAECFAGSENTCPLTSHCRLRDAIAKAVECFYSELDKMTLQELVRDNNGLMQLMNVHAQPSPLCSAAMAS